MYKLTIFIFIIYTVNIQAFEKQDTSFIKTRREFIFLYANDVYNGTDRYLTQIASFGLYSSYKTGKMQRPFRNAYLLEQKVYTPSDIFGDTIQRNDRPYCSTLTLDFIHSLFYENVKTQLNAGLTLGTLGKFAYGEQMQREVHYAVNSRQALGWQYQLRSAPFINLHTGLEKGLINIKSLDYILIGIINAGNVFNDLSIGQVIRLHHHHNYFLYLNPSTLHSWRISMSIKNDLKFTAYNGTLQGALGSRNNPYVLTHRDISPLVFNNQVLLHCGYGQFEISLSKSWLSKEFKAGLNHRWSAVKFLYNF